MLISTLTHSHASEFSVHWSDFIAAGCSLPFFAADGKFVLNLIRLILKSWWFSAGEIFQRLLRFVMRYCQIRQRFQEFEAGLVEYNY